MSRLSQTGRRNVLRGLGGAIAGSVLVGTTTAKSAQNPFDTPNSNYQRGEGASVTGDGEDIWTFATTNSAGEPTHLGIWLTSEAFEQFTSRSESAHLHLDFPAVDDLTYTFAGVDWNPAGHPPAGVWTAPHFDFHYYFVDEADIEAIDSESPGPILGVATYDIPESFWPENYVSEEPRFIVKKMANISTTRPLPSGTRISRSHTRTSTVCMTSASTPPTPVAL